ncbi:MULTISPECIES: hypothetical protein [unclassified Novosphingobium]|uniref:hypothetical protein n=1 Tax=unclassified Novosphingobium TaxID=2644732 RepID=UPI001358DB7E|nr:MULTISPECIES: hypothetical protein [unclassified Novosphingobium]
MNAGWEALQVAVAQAREEIAAHATDADMLAQGDAYVMRVVSASLADAFLGHLLNNDGLSRALPSRGGPNPHYLMDSARIDPARRYALTGRLNASERVGIGLYALDANSSLLEVGYSTFDRTNTGEDGEFRLDMAAHASGPSTLAIPPACRLILVRTLHRADGQPAAQLRLEGGDAASGLALATGSADGALARVAQGTIASVREYLRWTRAVASKPNCLDIAPPELAATVQGDRDTQYYLGYFDLRPGEWLEVSMPSGLPGYWSLHAYNHWFESLQIEGAHDRNTICDADGLIQVRVGPDIPSKLPNRMETTGLSCGALICRIIGNHDGEVPCARVMTSSDIPR